jgi:hypothetical protein
MTIVSAAQPEPGVGPADCHAYATELPRLAGLPARQ